MRNILIALLMIGGVGFFTESGAVALPGAAPSLDAVTPPSPTEQARVYCFNRYTGAFLHWGSCSRPVYRRTPGRTYCYNRRTGRFLHWGAC
jgi:hypothetical protein